MIDTHTISGFFTRARHRSKNFNNGESQNNSDSLLSKAREATPPQGELQSCVSSYIRECADSQIDLRKTSLLSHQLIAQNFQKELSKIMNDINVEFSDSKVSQYYDIDKNINLNEPKIGVDIAFDAQLSKYSFAAITMTNLLCVDSRFYQQESRSIALEASCLSFLDRIMQTTKDIEKSLDNNSAYTENTLYASAKVAASKAWLLYQTGNSSCLPILNNAKNTLSKICVFQQTSQSLAVKNRNMARIQVWLAIFQLDEKFCPLSSPTRKIRVNESIELLQNSLPLLKKAQDFFSVEKLTKIHDTALELLMVDAMLKINELLAENNRHIEMFSSDQILDVIAAVYDLNLGIIKREISISDSLALPYILARINKEFSFEASYKKSLYIIKNQSAQMTQDLAIENYKSCESRLPSVNYCNALAEYAHELFSSMDKGNKHWMNLVACPH